MTPDNSDPASTRLPGTTGAEPPAAAASLSSRFSDMKFRKTDFVLLVDDQPMVGEAIRRVVAEMDGFDYHYVSDPLAALAAIADIQPTVVLLDLIMPGLDGLSLLAQIRSDPATEYLPVVMLSTTESAETKAQAFNAGTDDYLVKIPNTVELQARLRYHSMAYRVRLQRDAAMQSLRESQRRLQEMNLQLLHLSQIDGLTGLANRRHYDETLNDELRRSERNGIPLTLMLLDVDHFKRFNDLYGHQQGDRCLQAVAGVLRGKAQRAGELAARYGGEEFGLVLPHCDANAAAAVAQTVLSAIAALHIPHAESESPFVSISIGVVTKMTPGRMAVEHFSKLADDALYAAKRGGRNRHEQVIA